MDWAALLLGNILAVLVRNPGAGLLGDHPALLPLSGHALLLVQGVALHGLQQLTCVLVLLGAVTGWEDPPPPYWGEEGVSGRRRLSTW